LFPGSHSPRVEANEVTLSIDIGPKSFTRLSNLITGYYIELVVLSGDPSEPDGLRVQSDISPLYTSQSTDLCNLCVSLPDKKGPWMAMVKVSSLENNEMAFHPRHYGMKVLKVGYV
jgi:hypothetical protein